MIIELAAPALWWLTAIVALLALVTAATVLASRSLFTGSVTLAALSACVSGALAALGYADAALAMALFGGALAPVLFLAAVLLATRSVKPSRRRAPWFSILAGGAAAEAILWSAPSLQLRDALKADSNEALFAMAALVFVAVSVCVGLLGYGERGVLGGAREGRDT